MPLWVLSPLVTSLVFAIALAVGRRRERTKQRYWAQRLSRDARTAPVGTLAGIASDGGGEIEPQTAPFTGRLCLGYHVEVLCAEPVPAGADARAPQWRRVFEDSAGAAIVVGRHRRRRGLINLRFAHVLFPPEPHGGQIAGATIFAGPSGAFDRRSMPAILHLLLATTVFPEETRNALYAPGRTLLFNERIVVPGQRIVATGASKRDAEGGARLSFSTAEPVLFAHGTAEEMKIRAPRPQPANVWRNAALLAAAIGLPITAAILHFVGQVASIG